MVNPIKAWSYSRLSGYESCPRQHKYRNIDKRPEPKSPAMLRGIKIHHEAARFLSGKIDQFPHSCAKFKDQFYDLLRLNPIIEQRWSFTKDWKPTTWMSKQVWLRATMDVGVVYDDMTAEVIDHKTGKRYDDDYSDQLALFAAVIMKKFPDKIEHVTTRMWYLDSGDEVIQEFTKGEAMERLSNIVERAEIMMTTDRFPPRPTFKCRFCHWRATNGGPCEF